MYINVYNIHEMLCIIWKRLTLSILLIILIFVAISCSSAEDGNGTGTGQKPEDIAYQYIASIKDGDINGAYILTTEGFRADITEEAYGMSDIVEMLTERLVSFEVGETIINDNEAEVEIDMQVLNLGEEEPVNGKLRLFLIKESNKWRITLSNQDFLPWKLENQPPLAEFKYYGVSVSLKYIMLYGTGKDTDSHTRIRFIIQNDSEYTLYWVLPVPGTSEGYIEDVSTGELYFMKSVGGTKKKSVEEFDHFSGDPGFLMVGPGSGGSIYILFDYIPETVEKFDMFLTGFHFSGHDEYWDVTYNSLPFRYDVAPN